MAVANSKGKFLISGSGGNFENFISQHVIGYKLSRCAGGMNSENDKSPPAYPSPGTNKIAIEISKYLGKATTSKSWHHSGLYTPVDDLQTLPIILAKHVC